jgi:ribosomal protein S18 acetylase RimI-like enzyme
MTETYSVRPMAEDDLSAVLAIDAAVGWRHDEDRFRYLLVAPDTRGVVAEVDGAVGGFAFMGLREPVGWLGPVAVDPPRAGRGLGAALVREADRFFREEERCDSAILEAYECNRRAIGLYDRFGFVVTSIGETFGTPEGAAPLVPAPAPDDATDGDDAPWITPLTEDDLPFLAALDDSYYGGWREDDLLYWLGAGLDRARLLRRGDEPIGYCLVEDATGRLGPAAAPTLPDFLALLDAILPLMPYGEGAPTHAVTLRVVDPTPATIAALADRGLVLAPDRRNVRMEKVYRRPARRMGGIYVSARPEKG